MGVGAEDVTGDAAGGDGWFGSFGGWGWRGRWCSVLREQWERGEQQREWHEAGHGGSVCHTRMRRKMAMAGLKSYPFLTAYETQG